MKKYVYGCVLFSLFGFCCFLALLFLAFPCFDPCENVELREVQSSDGQFEAVTFERDCGATTDFSTQVSILPVSSPLPNDAGNIFGAESNHGAAPSDPNVSVEWLNRRQLKISYNRHATTFTKSKTYQNVTIVYLLR